MVEGVALAALTMTLLGAGGSGVAGCLEGVAVRPAGALEDFGYPGLELRSSEPGESTIILDPSQTIGGYEVLVLMPEDCATGYRVQWQYETSVTVMAEGPHLDLLDWKHHTSEWTDLERDASGRLLVPVVSEAQATTFPEVSREELIEAVAERGGDWWSDLLVHPPVEGEEDWAVGLSEIRVRVLVEDGLGGWEPLWTLRFQIAMGC